MKTVIIGAGSAFGSRLSINILTVKAILERDSAAAFHALLLDPITARACSLDQVRAMFDEMWVAEGDLLDYYREHDAK